MLDRRIPPSLVWLAALLILSIAVAAIAGGTIYFQTRQAARTQADAMTGGNAKVGRATIARYGCAGCHVIPGIAGANGKVGPDLTGVGRRSELAGKLSNNPAAMVRWLMHPQTISPGSGMPEQGVGEADARDMAAFLYSKN